MTYLRLVGDWQPGIVLGLSLLLATIAFMIYRRETRNAGLGVVGWLLPALRGLAILLVALTLAEPIVESRFREGKPGRLTFLLDASRSMSIADSSIADAESAPSDSRFDRAVHMLAGPTGLIDALNDKFEITVCRSQEGQVADLWTSGLTDSELAPSTTRSWKPESWSEYSPLGDVLQRCVAQVGSGSGDGATATHLRASSNLSIVLMSDGQSNFGASPLSVAQELKQLGVHLFAVGMRPYMEPADLALRRLTVPEQVFRSDNLQGTFVVSELGCEGCKFSIQLEHESEIIWENSYVALGDEGREIEFSTPVAAIFARASEMLPGGADYAALPVKLTAKLQVESAEVNTANNTRDCYFIVASQKSRLLLIDGRSRWESRYLKNMFSRDPAWQMESVILNSHPTWNSSSQHLPETREDLFQYDLVVLGDVDPVTLPREWVDWLREFVEVAGGGLIVIDGARQHLRADSLEPLHRLLPIRWSGAINSGPHLIGNALPKQASLTIAGKGLEALHLLPSTTTVDGQNSQPTDHAEGNARIWSELPPVHFLSRVESLPGSEVLLEAVSEIERQPLLISRRYGAGRVLFLATDETWRWRYNVADLVHRRLWNQLARWVMKTPLSLNGEFVSIDTGTASYPQGEPINVRCELRESDGQPARGRSATAVVYAGNQVVTSVPLAEDSVPGSYFAQIESPLPAGDYQVGIAAAGFSSQVLELRSRFSVAEPAGDEMQRIACNESLLQAITAAAGGTYLRESQAQQMHDLLRPLSTGRIRQSATIIWQSYWWFSAAMLLLVTEWIVRKKTGLV